MQFSTGRDFDIPAAEVFDLIGDFIRSEQVLAAQGIRLRRTDPATDPGAGMGWVMDFDWNGRTRTVRLDVTRFNRPRNLMLEGSVGQFDITVDLSITAVTEAAARLDVQTDVRPRSIKARLMLQAAKLNKAELDRKYDQRIGDYLACLPAV